MFAIERIIAAAGMVWAAALLGAQLLLAWGGGRRDYSARAGSSLKGVLYNFSAAMTPAHKEAISNHPFNFTVGLVMHVGVGVAIFKILVVLIKPDAPPSAPIPAGGFLALAAAAALYLFVHRFLSPNLQTMSVFDDYLASFVTLTYLAVASLHEFGLLNGGAFLLVDAAASFYLPLGKLRHVLFCPVSRLDLGGRLGYRGTYPATRLAKRWEHDQKRER
jgi:hypothetical protein